MADVGAPEQKIIVPIHKVNPMEVQLPNPLAEIKEPKTPDEWAIKIYEKEAHKTGGGSQEIREAVWLSGLVGEKLPDRVLSELENLDLPLEEKKALMERSCGKNNQNDNKIGNKIYNLEQYIKALEEAEQLHNRIVPFPKETNQEERKLKRASG